MDLLKVVQVKGERTWEGSFEQYLEFQVVIDHWVKGGQIKGYQPHRLGWVGVTAFNFMDFEDFKIVEREPAIGEVWVNEYGDPVVYMGSPLLPIALQVGTSMDGDTVFTYAAPSVREYYREQLSDG